MARSLRDYLLRLAEDDRALIRPSSVEDEKSTERVDEWRGLSDDSKLEFMPVAAQRIVALSQRLLDISRATVAKLFPARRQG